MGVECPFGKMKFWRQMAVVPMWRCKCPYAMSCVLKKWHAFKGQNRVQMQILNTHLVWLVSQWGIPLCPPSAHAFPHSHKAPAGLAQIQRWCFHVFSCITVGEAIPAPGDPWVLSWVFPNCLWWHAESSVRGLPGSEIVASKILCFWYSLKLGQPFLGSVSVFVCLTLYFLLYIFHFLQFFKDYR